MKISQKELARILEMSVSGLKLMFTEGCPGKSSKNNYNLGLILPWLRRHKSLREKSEGLTAKRIDLLTEQIKAKVRQNLIDDGSYISRAEALEYCIVRAYSLRDFLLHLHRSLPQELEDLDARSIQEILKKTFHYGLQLYSLGGEINAEFKKEISREIKKIAKPLVARGKEGLVRGRRETDHNDPGTYPPETSEAAAPDIKK